MSTELEHRGHQAMRRTSGIANALVLLLGSVSAALAVFKHVRGHRYTSGLNARALVVGDFVSSSFFARNLAISSPFACTGRHFAADEFLAVTRGYPALGGLGPPHVTGLVADGDLRRNTTDLPSALAL